MRISVGAFIPAAPFQAIASRASRRSPAGSGPTHRQTLPLGGVCVNRTSMERTYRYFGGERQIRPARFTIASFQNEGGDSCARRRDRTEGSSRWISNAAARLAAILAALDMTAERRRSACLDRGHDLALVVEQPVALGSAKSVAVAAENIRRLQLLRAHDPGSFGRDHHERQPVERTWRVGDQMSGDLRITGGRRKVGMSEQHLDDADFDAALKKVRREAVAQAVSRHGLAQLHRASCDPPPAMRRCWT